MACAWSCGLRGMRRRGRLRRRMVEARLRSVRLIGMCAILLSACATTQPGLAPKDTPTAVLAYTGVPRPTRLANAPTSALSPTATSTASQTATTTPFPTVTSSARIEPTKAVFVQFGFYGGDGGNDYDAYLGRDAPRLVLYTDGQFILKSDGAFIETMVTADEMCSLRSQIEQTGFLNASEPFITTDEYLGDGAGEVIIQINGERNNKVNIYGPALPYAIEPISATYRLLRDFRPAGALQPYQPDKIVLWVEKPDPAYVDISMVQPWPSELPDLLDI